MNFNSFELTHKELFSKCNIIIFENNTYSQNILKLEKILKTKKFNSITKINKLNNNKDIDFVFFDVKDLIYFKKIKKIYINSKIILLTNYINNDIFELNFDEIILNISLFKNKNILELIYKNLISNLNNKKIEFDNLFNLISNDNLVSKIDKYGKITYVNDMFLKTTQYEKYELIGKDCSLIINKNLYNEKIKDILTILNKKDIWNGFLTNQNKYGQEYIVNTKIIKDKSYNGLFVGYIFIQTDVTNIVNQNKLTDLMLNEQINPIIIGQIGKGIINTNKAFFNYFNKDDCFVVSDLFFNKLYDDNVLLLNYGETISFKNVELLTKTNDIKIFDILQKRIDKSSNSYFITTFFDVTESYQKIEEAKLEANNKSTFLATMSHEIRTPLNGMIPYIDILLDNSNLNFDQINYLNIIKKSSSDLLKIINDILDISKLDSNNLNIESIEFDPNLEFNSIIDLYIEKANEKNISIIKKINKLPFLIGDPLRIKQIISNFLSNAIKFTKDNGKIEFIVKFKHIENNSINLYINIKDNGMGISKEYINKIFTPFTQQDDSISRKYGGTGLGLSISNNLAKLMKGNIKIKSKINQGTSFILFIPLLVTNQIINNKLLNKYININYDSNILVIDDNKTNQSLMNTLLNNHKIKVDIKSNGLDGYNSFVDSVFFNKSIYDIIFMDINMPIMNGIDSIKLIREYEYKNNLLPTIIIALTADALKDNKDKYLNYGFDYFITKPINKLEFDNFLYDILKNKIINNDCLKKEIYDNKININIQKISNELNIDVETSMVLYNDFINDSILYLKELLIYIENKNNKGIKHISHTIKGASSSLLLNDIYLISKELEDISLDSSVSFDVFYDYYLKLKNLINITY